MATRTLIQALNLQLNREFYASHLYLRLGDWCSEHSLNGAAMFLRNQAQNNVTKMMSLFDYTKQQGAAPVISADAPPACDCGSLEVLLQRVLEDLKQRSASLNNLARQARNCHDEATLSLLESLGESHAEDKEFLQALLEEVRSASREGLPLADTDRCFLNLLNYEHH